MQPPATFSPIAPQALAELDKHHHSQVQNDIRQENKLLNEYLQHNNKSHQDKRVGNILKQIQQQNNRNEQRVKSAIHKEKAMKKANDKVIVKLMEDEKDAKEGTEKEEDSKQEKKEEKKEDKKEEKTEGKKEEKNEKPEPKKEEQVHEAKAPAKEEKATVDKAVKEVLEKDGDKDQIMQTVKKIMKESKPKRDESDRYEAETKEIIAKGIKAKRNHKMMRNKASIIDKYGGNEFDREVDNESKNPISYTKEEMRARDSELDGEALTNEIGGKSLASEIQSSINGAGFGTSRKYSGIVSDVNDILTNVSESQVYFQKS